MHQWTLESGQSGTTGNIGAEEGRERTVCQPTTVARRKKRRRREQRGSSGPDDDSLAEQNTNWFASSKLHGPQETDANFSAPSWPLRDPVKRTLLIVSAPPSG
ncbi:uncharacterized protein LOC122537206 [Frieseomelitta varia]|uniref:uncharacterized protein LOC122537206 n=1 Tax=Frieseomelitta varia TaxID=561572 RepID=UPI001CB67C99|nr:uncharacterized protein LOC122537206 [Frieseomelitta varia]